jgi:hypothetical protein
VAQKSTPDANKVCPVDRFRYANSPSALLWSGYRQKPFCRIGVTNFIDDPSVTAQ